MLARIRKSMEEKDRGFTLIELLVVMIIIGILAAIAIPVFLNQRKKAVDTSIKSDLRQVAASVETSYVDNQNYTSTTGWVVVGVGGASALTSGAAATTSSTTSSTIATDVRTSSGNYIQYRSATTGTGYCIRGANLNATADGSSSSKYYIYDSQLGGLQSTMSSSTANCSAS